MEKLHEYDLSLKHHQNSEVTGIPLQNYDCLQKDQPIQDVRKWSAGPQPQPVSTQNNWSERRCADGV